MHELVQGYVDAWEQGDAATIVDLLAADATFSMPPFAVWYRGRDAIAAFLPRWPLRERWRLVPIRANCGADPGDDGDAAPQEGPGP